MVRKLASDGSHFVRRSCLLFALSMVVPTAVFAQEQENNLGQTESAASLSRIRQQASQFTLSKVAADDGRPKLCDSPLLRYSDAPNGYRDAAVWVWELKGIPIAVAKVEDLHAKKAWQYCVASLSQDEIAVSRPGQPAWQSRGPGVAFQPIAGAPTAVETPVRRMLIMKSQARRFSGNFQAGTPRGEKMRPMPRPIHRFSSPETGLIDGAMFAFSISGTNPTAFVIIALRESGENPKVRRWEYGVVGMTSDAASIYLDHRVVWSKKSDYSKRFYENWYFHVQPKEHVKNSPL